ncbi:glycerophosphodiester phosphodiesterase family protein [Fusibacter bizertensis]|uniref:Glycerophosphodiester phosphodiesterase family protein n=1 Tax=Fusibacter bizertensis TaxID=1488331 RepID=A0ABT6NA18_9FIRM|nr:glycerophosphodiester phosphodiesterase family protein [Fusibacter bizertensis]MDH8677251.1 glycerophosphodiester phosphodiesterase family protein [Fusibacter bizertensis]
MTLIFGHRGAKAYYAENTILSFEHAIEMGADGIELDIHYSKDGEIMVFHDFTLNRMCGVNGSIFDYTLSELKRFKVQYRNQYQEIPTLKEVLDLILSLQVKHQKKIVLNVELKAGSDFYPDIEKNAMALCYSKLSKDQVVFSSFDHYALKEIRGLDAMAQTGILTASALVDPWEYVKKLGANYYHPAYLSLTPRLLSEISHTDLKVNTYTVNDTTIAKQLMLNGINAIITDSPDIMVELRKGI